MIIVPYEALLRAHFITLQKHGGLPGIRSEQAIRGALERPLNLELYEPSSTVAQLAAAASYGVAKAHGFNDGNKRAAFFTLTIQFRLLGYRLECSQVEARDAILAISASTMDETEFAHWISAHIVPVLSGS